MWRSVVLFLTAICSSTQAANILYIDGVPSPSHFIWHKALINGLAAKGHNVTALSVDVEDSSLPNLSYIKLEGVYEGLNEQMELGSEIFEKGETNPFASLAMFNQYVMLSCELTLNSKGLRLLLDYPNEFKFDLIIGDFLNGPCLSAVAQHKFGRPPYIGATAANVVTMTSMLSGAYIYSGSIPDYALDVPQNMSYRQRFTNFLYSHYVELFRTYETYPKIDKIVRKVIPDITYIGELDRDARVILLNSHPAIQYREAMMPNVISVGGMQIAKPKELPEDLQKIVETAKKGAILFSLGTNIRSNLLGDNRIIEILNAMSQFPEYQFLWKFESDSMPIEVPKNVYIRKWMPQNDLLAHPNLKLFITHSGLLSIQEAIWNGVPIIGFPVFADQFQNINYCIAHGVGKRLSIKNVKSGELADAIREVLSNESYRENMSLLSKVFRDQKESPLERAVWWVEWVLRNPTSQVLQSNAVWLDWSVKYSFDVMVPLLLAGLMALLASVKITCLVLCRKAKQQKKTKRE
ncbi:UDP-glucosyltransferase 2-like [Aedes albopictus]|uniref:UDP-glucuronosyltransferase n=1 Tax=Aedes albopictus TaxID=7160 RepID=A0ABM1XWB6_AEDAL